MTAGHSYDYQVQEQDLRHWFAYIEVIGSKPKTATVNAKLREAGIEEVALKKVDNPICTLIKAVSSEETAVSITG